MGCERDLSWEVLAEVPEEDQRGIELVVPGGGGGRGMSEDEWLGSHSFGAEKCPSWELGCEQAPKPGH